MRPLIGLLRPKQLLCSTGTRPLSFLHSPRRPRLPYLLRPSTPLTSIPRPTLHVQSSHSRSLISANTKEYLLRESLIAARIVVYGYTAIFITGCIAFTAAIVYVENNNPTPDSLPWKARFGIAFTRVLLTWTKNRWGAIEIMKDIIDGLEKQGWKGKDGGWRRGYIMALKLLAEIEEGDDQLDAAREHYQRIVNTPRESERQENQWIDIKLAAALRVSKIAEFQKDLDAAEAALRDAVYIALPPRSLPEPITTEEVPELPNPESAENTTLLLKAVTELAIFLARHNREEQALELFTRVLAARRNFPAPEDPTDSKSAEVVSDPCAEAETMTYIGEILFAMGDKKQGVAWSKEAYGRSEPLAEFRGACKECALVAARNISTMATLMEGVEESKGRWSRFFGSTKELGEVESAEKWDEAVALLEKIRVTRGL